MQIAFVTETYPPETNGVSLTVRRAVENLRQRGHCVRLVRPRQAVDADGKAGFAAPNDWLVPGLPVPMYSSLRVGCATPGGLRRHFLAGKTELVHVATEGPLGWAAVTAARALGLPVTSDFRTNFHSYAPYYRLGWAADKVKNYLRWLHNLTACTFVPTRQTQAALRADGFERLHLVGRGVDSIQFSPRWRDAQLRVQWGADHGPVLLYVGRLAAEKNVALALRAYRAVRQLVPHARMVVVGTGPMHAALAHDFPDVLFVGEQRGEALAQHYASADLFLFTSMTDTFGNVVLEALASGLPVLAYNMAAAAEHVRERVSGRLVARGNENDFVIAACLLASQREEIESMRAHARFAALRADWNVVLGAFEQKLLDIGHGHPAAVAQDVVAA